MSANTLSLTRLCKHCNTEKSPAEFPQAFRVGADGVKQGTARGACCKVCRAEKRSPGITAARALVEQERRRLMVLGLKICNTCNEELPVANFAKSKAERDGLCYKCRACNAKDASAWRDDNPEAFRDWYAENKEARAAYWKDWYANNRDHRAATFREWSQDNRARITAISMRRYTKKKNANVGWADQSAILEIYALSAFLSEATGIKHEVDHYYPLQGETVCGLHCEVNLQIITKIDNIRKKNKMPEDFYATY